MRRLLFPLLLACCGLGADVRLSGLQTMSPALQAMQRDDASNPAMLWVQAGREIWAQRCAGCHQESKLGGLAARYPAFDTKTGRPVTLEARIQSHQELPVDDLLAVTAFIALQSRGMAITSPDDPRLAPFLLQGERLFKRRMGQLNLSCAQCHDERAGLSLGGGTIPQGHPTGYPLYRLEWQTLGNLERRLNNCVTGVRAAPLSGEELVALELYLKQRAAGMPMDAPAVRP
ncbi:sulfur oxidation c-type cytochrome SoxA [Burkholderiaceae bacterium UC74_6]